jgi:hypothetical protein
MPPTFGDTPTLGLGAATTSAGKARPTTIAGVFRSAFALTGPFPPFARAHSSTQSRDAVMRLEDASCFYAALAYARRDLKVIPLHSPTLDGNCSCARESCSSPAKHPRTSSGVSDASSDPDTISSWWGLWPDANVGIATGDGLVVLDEDGIAGERSLEALKIGAAWPLGVPEVKTGRGRQFYFHTDTPIGNSVHKLGPGLDVRGVRGYVVAPPSRHISGAVYSWTVRLPLCE